MKFCSIFQRAASAARKTFLTMTPNPETLDQAFVDGIIRSYDHSSLRDICLDLGFDDRAAYKAFLLTRTRAQFAQALRTNAQRYSHTLANGAVAGPRDLSSNQSQAPLPPPPPALTEAELVSLAKQYRADPRNADYDGSLHGSRFLAEVQTQLAILAPYPGRARERLTSGLVAVASGVADSLPPEPEEEPQQLPMVLSAEEIEQIAESRRKARLAPIAAAQGVTL
jgi:hypothetical protein